MHLFAKLQPKTNTFIDNEFPCFFGDRILLVFLFVSFLPLHLHFLISYIPLAFDTFRKRFTARIYIIWYSCFTNTLSKINSLLLCSLVHAYQIFFVCVRTRSYTKAKISCSIGYSNALASNLKFLHRLYLFDDPNENKANATSLYVF